MRDPDLVFRAQLAAASLESSWHRWRVVHGLAADPVPTVSSYVGYSLEEPWGQPRVVFGLAAEDAEQLAGLLERHDCVGPVYAAVATLPGARDMPAQSGRVAPLPVPRQAPPMAADQPDETAEISAIGWVDRIDRDDRDDRGDRIDRDDRPGTASGYDEPLFRQAAAAMREAALKRRAASNGQVGDSPATGSQGQAEGQGSDPRPGHGQSQAAALDEVTDDGALSSRPHMITEDADRPASAAADFFERSSDDEPMGSLAQAATAARAAAEARIKAALTEYRSRAGDMYPYPDYDDEVEAPLLEQPMLEPPLPSAGPPAELAEPVLVMPEIYATDVLEPLPRPESRPESRRPVGIPARAGRNLSPSLGRNLSPSPARKPPPERSRPQPTSQDPTARTRRARTRRTGPRPARPRPAGSARPRRRQRVRCRLRRRRPVIRFDGEPHQAQPAIPRLPDPKADQDETTRSGPNP